MNKNFHFPVAGLAAFAITGLWGCLLIYASRSFGSDPWFFAGRQLFWLAAGCVCFAVCAALPFRRIMENRYRLFGISAFLLIAVLFFGIQLNGMRGWFVISNYFLFQPSEFAKPVFLLMLAGFAGNPCQSQRMRFLKMTGTAGCLGGLVLLEPDFGTAGIYYAGFLIMLWIGGFSVRYLIPVLAAAPAALTVFVLWKPYARERILALLNPDSLERNTWHIRQFRYAMAEGGFFGSDHGGALWSNAYLPLAHSDSLYAAIIEISGLAGGLILLTAFCAIVWCFLSAAEQNRLPRYVRLYIAGTAFLYLTQALIHMGVNVVLLPPTGITLPLLSYGGSSLCSTMLAFGLAFSAIRDRSTDKF